MFTKPVVESDNDSMGEAPLPDSHLPTADLEAEGDDEDEQSTTDDDSYNNLIKCKCRCHMISICCLSYWVKSHPFP